MKILVCGSTGFIGRNVCEILRSTHDITGTYYKSKPIDGIKSVYADLTNKNDVKNAITDEYDVLIHAAATTSGAKDIVSKPYYHVTDNAVMGSLIFREAYEKSIKHVVFPSCTVMYQPSSSPLKETDFNASDKIFPTYFGAGWTKVYLEKMCEFYAGLGRNKFTAIRHSNIYGPYDKYDLDRSHFFGATITKVMTNTDGKLVVWGDGSTGRDLLHVNDLVRFISACMLKQSNSVEIVNVGCGVLLTVKEVVEKIVAHSGKDIRIEYDVSKPSINTKLCLDCSKAYELFGWKPTIPIDDGIKLTLTWYQNAII